MAIKLTTLCPHCDTPNPVFGGQSCLQCGLNMHSDQAQTQLQEHIRPLCEKIEEMVAAWEQDATNSPVERHLRIWMEQLMTLTPQYPFLDGFLSDIRKRLAPWYRAVQQKRLLNINWAILLLLLVAPLLALWWTDNWTLPLLLSLPVLGWGYIGIFQFMRTAK